jgi:hypothetical protein
MVFMAHSNLSESQELAASKQSEITKFLQKAPSPLHDDAHEKRRRVVTVPDTPKLVQKTILGGVVPSKVKPGPTSSTSNVHDAGLPKVDHVTQAWRMSDMQQRIHAGGHPSRPLKRTVHDVGAYQRTQATCRNKVAFFLAIQKKTTILTFQA